MRRHDNYARRLTFLRADSPHQEIVSPSRHGLNFLDKYLIAVICIITSLIFFNIPVYLQVIHPYILPKYFYYLFAVLIAPFLLLRPKSVIRYFAQPFAIWAVLFIIINSMGLITALDVDENIVSQISTQNQYLIYSILLGFIFSITPAKSYERIYIILAFTIPFLVLFDFVAPGILYTMGINDTVSGRASATYLNPNIAGEVMLLACLLAIPVTPSRYRMLLLSVVGAGIILTFSRGAIIAWVLVYLFFQFTGTISKKVFVFVIALLVIMPILVGGFKYYLEGRQDLQSGDKNIFSRLDSVQSLSIEDYSSQDRLLLLENGWDLFLENPLIGVGCGATPELLGGQGPHNEFVMVAAEYGILGIALWIALAIILWNGNYFKEKKFQYAVTIMFIVSTMFTHNMFGQDAWLLTFAIVSGKRPD